MTRFDILDAAGEIVGGHRVTDYGEPEDNFGVIARLWSAYLGIDISEVDVSMLMVLFKAGRIKSGTATEDSFVDICGYAACGGEIAERGRKNNDDSCMEKGTSRQMKNTQTEMEKISNLITDMTLRGATSDELARAVRHSMVVIDAEKNSLDYIQSEADNGIKALKKKYQGRHAPKWVDGVAHSVIPAAVDYGYPKRND